VGVSCWVLMSHGKLAPSTAAGVFVGVWPYTWPDRV
jgi:hypothetical protein